MEPPSARTCMMTHRQPPRTGTQKQPGNYCATSARICTSGVPSRDRYGLRNAYRKIYYGVLGRIRGHVTPQISMHGAEASSQDRESPILYLPGDTPGALGRRDSLYTSTPYELYSIRVRLRLRESSSFVFSLVAVQDTKTRAEPSHPRRH